MPNALAPLSKSDVIDRLNRAKASIQRHRAEAEQVAMHGGAALAGFGGAVASGALQHYRPNLVEGRDAPTDGIVGGLLAASSFFIRDRSASAVALAGAIGMYAPAVSRRTAQMLAERQGS